MRRDLHCALCEMDAGIDGDVLNLGASAQGRRLAVI